MPNKYGAAIDITDVGDRQTPSAPTPPAAIAPIQIRRWVRNGKAPSAELQNMLNGAANYAALYRSKEVFSAYSLPNSGASSGSTRWRFPFHTGPYTHSLWSVVGLLNPYGATAAQAKVTLKIYSDATESTLVGSVDYNYGAGTDSGGFGWRQAKWPMGWVEGLSADTDYYGRFDLSGSPRLLCASVFDMQSLTETFGGYLTQSVTSHSPVLGVDRSNVHTLLRNVWKRGGAKVMNWVVQPGNHSAGADSTETNSISITTTSATGVNILDRSSTTVSSSTPGWYFDMRNKARVSQTSGVPVVMKAFGRNTGTSELTILVLDSGGSTVATLNGFTTSNSWKSVAFELPATLAKYDLSFYTAVPGERSYLYAAGIYEYES